MGPVTVLDALRERSSEAERNRATDALLAAMPVDRPVAITSEVLEAAFAGDVALLVTLFAEEVDPEPGELEELREAERADDGSRATIDEVRRELGLAKKG